jgi:hypothetical protein
MAIKQRVRYPFYDTDTLVTGANLAQSIPFFQNGQGSTNLGGVKKSILDTNITTNGVMPFDKFVAMGLRFNVFTRDLTPVTASDMNLVLNNGVINMLKNDNVILSIPAHWVPAGTGIVTGGQATTGTNGQPALSNIFRILPETYTTSDRMQFNYQLVNSITIASSSGVYIELEVEGLVDKKL